jgi:hypothetical protein
MIVLPKHLFVPETNRTFAELDLKFLYNWVQSSLSKMDYKERNPQVLGQLSLHFKFSIPLCGISRMLFLSQNFYFPLLAGLL